MSEYKNDEQVDHMRWDYVRALLSFKVRDADMDRNKAWAFWMRGICEGGF